MQPCLPGWTLSRGGMGGGNLAPSNTGVGTNRLTIKLADGSYAFKCLVHIYDSNHLYLNGFTVLVTGDVNLAPNTGSHTGKHLCCQMAMKFSSALVTSTTSLYMNGYTVPGNVNLASSFSGVATGTHMKIG